MTSLYRNVCNFSVHLLFLAVVLKLVLCEHALWYKPFRIVCKCLSVCVSLELRHKNALSAGVFFSPLPMCKRFCSDRMIVNSSL